MMRDPLPIYNHDSSCDAFQNNHAEAPPSEPTCQVHTLYTTPWRCKAGVASFVSASVDPGSDGMFMKMRGTL